MKSSAEPNENNPVHDNYAHSVGNFIVTRSEDGEIIINFSREDEPDGTILITADETWCTPMDMPNERHSVVFDDYGRWMNLSMNSDLTEVLSLYYAAPANKKGTATNYAAVITALRKNCGGRFPSQTVDEFLDTLEYNDDEYGNPYVMWSDPNTKIAENDFEQPIIIECWPLIPGLWQYLEGGPGPICLNRVTGAVIFGTMDECPPEWFEDKFPEDEL